MLCVFHYYHGVALFLVGETFFSIFGDLSTAEKPHRCQHGFSPLPDHSTSLSLSVLLSFSSLAVSQPSLLFDNALMLWSSAQLHVPDLLFFTLPMPFPCPVPPPPTTWNSVVWLGLSHFCLFPIFIDPGLCTHTGCIFSTHTEWTASSLYEAA